MAKSRRPTGFAMTGRQTTLLLPAVGRGGFFRTDRQGSLRANTHTLGNSTLLLEAAIILTEEIRRDLKYRQTLNVVVRAAFARGGSKKFLGRRVYNPLYVCGACLYIV